jgi:DNA-binding MarR family transcriptional regulator
MISVPTETRSDSEQFSAAWVSFLAAIRRARARVSTALPISLSQYHLLLPLLESTALSVGELAASAGVTAPTATRGLDALEREGLVTRNTAPGDRRSVVVALTPEGRRMMLAERRRLDAKRRALFEQLEPEEREQAARLLARLAELVEEMS